MKKTNTAIDRIAENLITKAGWGNWDTPASGIVQTPLADKVVNLNTQSGLSLSKGGKVSSASKRADGCAVRGKTRA